MRQKKEILLRIKKEILSVVPDAKIYLFGSRARGDFHDESDWDILIITQTKPDSILKNRIREQLFPVSLEISYFINTIIVSEEDWLTNPSYYSLYQATLNETMPV